MICKKCGRTMNRESGTDNYYCLPCGVFSGDGPTTAPKTPKHRNKKTYVDGIPFDSQLEANYYCELKLRQRAGEIDGFSIQPKFVIATGATHRADFTIFYPDGTYEIIDTKGYRPKDYIFKMKVFNDRYPRLEIKEVKG